MLVSGLVLLALALACGSFLLGQGTARPVVVVREPRRVLRGEVVGRRELDCRL